MVNNKFCYEKNHIDNFISEIERKNSNEPEFMQAVREISENVLPYIVSKDIYHGKNILIMKNGRARKSFNVQSKLG